MHDHHSQSGSAADGRPRLAFLGTQGWIPTPRRGTTCLAYRDGAALLVFDAGTGLSRFLSPPAADLLRGVDEVHLLLTHYHLDHTCGLSYLSGVFPGLDVTVHVPTGSVNGVEPRDGAPELIRPPFFPEAFLEQKRVSLATVEEGPNEVAGIEVTVRRQRHADVSVGYRVGDRFVFATDTVADEGTAELADGVDVLVHEAWIDGREEDDPAQRTLVRKAYSSHTSARQAAGLARAADVGELYLVHLNPLFDEEYYASMLASARTVFERTRIPADLDERCFPEDR